MTDARLKPLTPNPTHVPIFGAKNEGEKHEMASDHRGIEGQVESVLFVFEVQTISCDETSNFSENKIVGYGFLFFNTLDETNLLHHSGKYWRKIWHFKIQKVFTFFLSCFFFSK